MILFGSFQETLSALGTFNKTAFQLQKAAALAQATVSIAVGIARAQELGFPANIFEMVRVAAVGAAQIAAIHGASFGSGGVSGGGGGGGGGLSGAEPVFPADPFTGLPEELAPSGVGTTITINLGDDDELISVAAVRRLLEQLDETAGEVGSLNHIVVV